MPSFSELVSQHAKDSSDAYGMHGWRLEAFVATLPRRPFLKTRKMGGWQAFSTNEPRLSIVITIDLSSDGQ